MGLNQRTSGLSAVVRSTEMGLFVSLLWILLLIYKLDKSGSFFTTTSLVSLIHQVGLYGVLAVGAAVVIIAGGIDLSVGAVVAISSVFCAKLMTEWLHKGTEIPPSTAVVLVSMALTLLFGLLIGLFHAFLINRFRLPPFIATLATMSSLRSLASILSDNRTITIKSDLFRALGKGEWATFATFAVVATLASVMMGATVLGRHLFALGGNEAAARLSGLKNARLKYIAYGLSGILAALAGLLFAGRSGQGSPELGRSYELFAITAAVVGGCSLAGGVGSIRGTVLGLVLLQTMIKGTGLVVRNIDFYVNYYFGRVHVVIGLNSTQVEGLVLGAVIIAAVAINQKLRPKL